MFRRLFSGRRCAGRRILNDRHSFRVARLHVERLESRTLLSAVFPDFNGDGFDDVAIGIPFESLGTSRDKINAGAVQVLYGTASGLSAANNQFWTQDTVGIADRAEQGDRFGSALAWGDFNKDGFDDLAIGVPFESLGSGSATIFNAGAVHILYGSASGLSAFGSQFWHQNVVSVLDRAEQGDQFGAALAAGDFDNDGYDDLAIGIPNEGLGSGFSTIFNAGAVQILYGTDKGLSAERDQIWHQNVNGVEDRAETGDRFGSALAVGDFNNDGRDDLAIGVPFETLGSGSSAIFNAGAVNVLYGTGRGLRARNDQFWHQNTFNVLDRAERDDRFGSALVAGDFNNDGRDDLAIGVPFESIGSGSSAVVNAGGVNVLYGSANRLTAAGNQFFSQNTPTILDSAETDDRFGWSLAAGDFDGDGRDDLAIGVPFETIGLGSTAATSAGAINVLYGGAAGLLAAGNQFFHQDIGFVVDSAESGDRFGWSLTAGDYDNDGRDDLTIGVPLEDVPTTNSVRDAGAVNVLYGTLQGLDDVNSQLFHQDTPGILDTAEEGDSFGWSLVRR